VCTPAFVGGRTLSPGGEGGAGRAGGSIFLKTRDIGLPSYSNNLSTHPQYRACGEREEEDRGRDKKRRTKEIDKEKIPMQQGQTNFQQNAEIENNDFYF
jgi:hypothetical protein